jgi:hypothetical protein
MDYCAKIALLIFFIASIVYVCAKTVQEQLNARAKRREKLAKAKAEAKRIQVVADAEGCNNASVSKFAIALQGEIERRKLDKNPIKFKLQRKIKFVSKLEIALKEVINRRKISSINCALC